MIKRRPRPESRKLYVLRRNRYRGKTGFMPVRFCELSGIKQLGKKRIRVYSEPLITEIGNIDNFRFIESSTL